MLIELVMGFGVIDDHETHILCTEPIGFHVVFAIKRMYHFVHKNNIRVVDKFFC